MKIQLERKDLLNAIKLIDDNPNLKSGRHSSTYDLIFNGRKYPPILVLSVANQSKEGSELTLADFNNNIDLPFRILKENGFEINPKSRVMKPDIREFIKVANEQKTGQGTTDSAKFYARKNKETKEGLNTEISFGVGRASSIPWIAFIGFRQNVKNGIYPVFLYYKDLDTLILAYGVSETTPPSKNWKNLNSKPTIKEYFEKNLAKKPDRYGSSYVFKYYDSNSLPSEEVLASDLEQIIKEYKTLFNEQSSKEMPYSLPQKSFSLPQFKNSLLSSGLIYSEHLLARFTASLITKPFVILTGLSGSGKTKLAQAFVEWLCQDKSQYSIIPVGADWTNREPLLGYPNALSQRNM